MDNPQHYQPLSHALHPPVGGPSRTQAQSQTQFSVYPTPTNGVNPQEEEEEEDDDDEGLVEEQLNDSRQQPGSNTSSPRMPAATSTTETQNTQTPQQQQQSSEPPEKKRRPGRPRGSKNRKPRGSGSEVPGKQPIAGFFSYPSQPLHSTGPGSAPPVLPDVNAQNQQYYEFQWRVLNLCAEFYGAAEELVKATTPLVVAQCYQMGPGSNVDPIMMLNEAKRNCDTLLANPTRLIANPPPPLYPTIPNFNPHPVPQPPPAASPSKSAASQSSVITNPQSFVVSLGAGAPPPPPPPPPHAQFSTMYPQYPTAPYYQYPPYPAYYPAPVAPPPAPTQQTPGSTIPASAPGINQGSWSDEETERLKKLAEESRAVNPSTNGEIEWDWVVHQWGNGRTRHQILIKATSIGLKESSSRGTKRRRESESVAPVEATPAPAPIPQAPAAPSSVAPVANAANSTTSTPAQSPALAHQQRPSSTSATVTSTSTPAVPVPPKPNHPWPMPTVAANTPSPVITSAGVEPQKISYYRPRPHEGRDAGTSSSSKPNSKAGQGQGQTMHHYMFQPNGRKEA